MSIHWTGSNDRGSGECLADGSLTGSLGAIELGCRSWRSVEVRYVDQPRNANTRGDLGNAPSTFSVYIVKGEVSFLKDIDISQSALHWHERRRTKGKKDILGLVITTNEIVHNIRVPNAFCNLFFIVDIPFLPSKHGGKRI